MLRTSSALRQAVQTKSVSRLLSSVAGDWEKATELKNKVEAERAASGLPNLKHRDVLNEIYKKNPGFDPHDLEKLKTKQGAIVVFNTAYSLEWVLSSPPPLHAFLEPPIMVEWPEGEDTHH